MSKQAHYMTESQLIVFGRRHSCDDVAREASEASARWQRDLLVLATYGLGAAALAEFEADRAKHDALRAARPEAVANKKTSVSIRDKQVADGWSWVNRVTSALGLPARNDEPLSTALSVARPGDDAGLESSIQALAKILAANQAKLSPDSQADQRLLEVDGLCSALQSSPGILQTRKGQTVADTTQIDLYDGKLCIWIRDLNRAARQAIRSGHLRASLHEYALHHLKQSGNPVPKPVPTPPEPPVPPTPTAER